MDTLEGKVAFVTGGSAGIGLGIVHAFIEAGMKVAIGYKTEANMELAMAQLGAARDRIRAIRVDVTDRAALERAAAEAVGAFSKVHVLVCNAGVVVGGPIGEATYDDWDWLMGVNLTGVFNTVRAFLPHIKAHGEGGQILGMASVLGLVANGGIGVYSAAKFAVVGMMEALRAELASTHIGASVICPGLVRSSLWNAERNRPAELAATNPEMVTYRGSQDFMAGVNRAHEVSMDPLELGRLVVAGIRNNDLYILTHPEIRERLSERCEALLASIPADQPPPARVSAERSILENPTYASERDRLRAALGKNKSNRK